MPWGSAPKCPGCDRTVYPMEQVTIFGQNFVWWDWLICQKPIPLHFQEIIKVYLVFEGDSSRQEAFSRKVHWLSNGGLQVRLVAKGGGACEMQKVWFNLV